METAAVEEQRKNISAFTKFWSIHVNRFIDRLGVKKIILCCVVSNEIIVFKCFLAECSGIKHLDGWCVT